MKLFLLLVIYLMYGGMTMWLVVYSTNNQMWTTAIMLIILFWYLGNQHIWVVACQGNDKLERYK